MQFKCAGKIICCCGIWLLLALTTLAAELVIRHQQDVWTFSREDLAAMPSTTMVTATPWTVDLDEYTGVALVDLVARLDVGENVELLSMSGLDGYAVTAPLAELAAADATLVYARNGEAMPVRAFGPYWLLFPFSDRPELLRRDIRNASVWQLQSIELLAEQRLP